MKVTIDVDESLLADARRATSLDDLDELIAHALRSLVVRDAARRLADMGGTMPDATAGPRRRPAE